MIEEERDALVLEIRDVHTRAARQIKRLWDRPPSSFEEQEGRRHVDTTIRQDASLNISPLFHRLCESLATEMRGDIRILTPVRREHIDRALQLISAQ
jgi:hypothetical protein